MPKANMLADAAEGAFSHLTEKETPVSGFAGPDIPASATIQPTTAILRYTPAADRAALVMDVPAFGQAEQITIINESASHTLTFATAATSHVANGASCVVSALAAVILVWNPNAQLWFQVRAA